jgi:hypothetical protein
MESRNNHKGRTFFRDILQIKSSNSAWPPLTLVDLPGLVISGMPDGDIKILKEIITTQMSKPNTLILAVVCASNDAKNHAILKFAEQFDGKGRRTMVFSPSPTG